MHKAGWVTLSAASFLGGLAAWWIFKNSRFASVRVAYGLVIRDGAFELREYDTLPLVATPVADENDSFMRLFGYISGENRERRKIAMTIPVLVADEDGQRTMSFVLPQKVVQFGVPTATSPSIDAAVMSGGCFAVYRFSGACDLLVESAGAAVLRDWVREQGFRPAGEPVVAFYDPPWVPAPLRKNEILLRVN